MIPVDVLRAYLAVFKSDHANMGDFKSASELFENDVLSVTLDSAVAARNVPGGTAPDRVLDAVQKAHGRLQDSATEA